MLKRVVLLIVLSLIFISKAKADGWDDFANVDRMWDGQKSITNQEFEQVMEKLEEKGKQKEEKQVKKKRKKLFGSGTTLHNELNPDNDLNEFESLKSKEAEGVVINVPVSLVLAKTVLEKGFYKVLPERDEDSKKIYINFYQSQFLKGRVEVIETDDDYEKETIDFAEIIPYDDSFVKIIFGSIDFNAYAFIPYLQQNEN